MTQIIRLDKVTKSYKGVCVLDQVTETFSSGNIYGIIGRNGSGKTMLFKAICGFIKLDSGSVEVDGKVIGQDVDFPENTGIMIEAPCFTGYLSGKENLKNLAAIKRRIGEKEIEGAMEKVGLDYHSKKKVRQYSMGMKQRLGIAQAIMEDPDILILDEPTNALDAEAVKDFRKILISEKEKGKIILLASHNREDIEVLCDKVFLMEKGVLKESMTDLR